MLKYGLFEKSKPFKYEETKPNHDYILKFLYSPLVLTFPVLLKLCSLIIFVTLIPYTIILGKGFDSSWTWRCVVGLVSPDISKHFSALSSIVGQTNKNRLGLTQLSKRRDRFLRNPAMITSKFPLLF